MFQVGWPKQNSWGKISSKPRKTKVRVSALIGLFLTYPWEFFFLRKLFFQRCLAITINFGGVGMGNGIYIRRFCNYFVFNKYFTSLKCQEIVNVRWFEVKYVLSTTLKKSHSHSCSCQCAIFFTPRGRCQTGVYSFIPETVIKDWNQLPQQTSNTSWTIRPFKELLWSTSKAT